MVHEVTNLDLWDQIACQIVCDSFLRTQVSTLVKALRVKITHAHMYSMITFLVRHNLSCPSKKTTCWQLGYKFIKNKVFMICRAQMPYVLSWITSLALNSLENEWLRPMKGMYSKITWHSEQLLIYTENTIPFWCTWILKSTSNLYSCSH
mgnify:CR=1 FL=1